MESGPNWYKAHSVLGGAPGVGIPTWFVWISRTSSVSAVACSKATSVYLDIEGPESNGQIRMLSDMLFRSMRVWTECDQAHYIAFVAIEHV